MENNITLCRQRLGLQPEKALRAFVDLGLDDREIGRYHAIPPAAVSTLLKHYRIGTASDKASKADSPIDEIENDMYLADVLHTNGDENRLPNPKSEGKPDTAKSDLRQLALFVRSMLRGGH